MRLGGSESLAFAAVVLGSGALLGVFFCMRREGPGGGPIYVAAAVAVAAFALLMADDFSAIDLGLPLRPEAGDDGGGL